MFVSDFSNVNEKGRRTLIVPLTKIEHAISGREGGREGGRE